VSSSRPARDPSFGALVAPLALGMFLRALQMTVIGPSLIDISKSLRVTLADVGWIMALYAAGSLVAQPVAGRVSDARGRKAVFTAAVAIFGVGSVACALSRTLPELIAGRVIQSLGAGAIAPAATALIGDRVAERRQGAALGVVYGMFALAAVMGSVVGGGLIDGGRALSSRLDEASPLRAELAIFPWHLVFWINVPLTLATLALAYRLPDDRRESPGVDVGLRAFFRRFATLVVSRGSGLIYLIAILSGIPIYSVTMYGAAYFMEQFHASAVSAGVALLALGIALGLGLSAGGALIPRVGPKNVLLLGAIALAAGDASLAALTSAAGVLAAFGACGLGMGLVSAPPNVLIFRYAPQEQRGMASGVLTMLGSTGAISAPIVVTAYLRNAEHAQLAAFRQEFLLAFVVAVVTLALVMLLPAPAKAS